MSNHFFEKIKRIFLFDTHSISSSENIKKRTMEDNRKFAIIWSSVLLGYWSYSLIMSLSDPLFECCRDIYVVAFSIYAVTLLLSLSATIMPSLIRPIAFVIGMTFIGAGIGIAVFLAPQTIVIFASVLIVPVLFVSDTFSNVIQILIAIISFALIGKNMMAPDIYRWTLVNMIVFSSAGIIVGHFVNKARFERYVFAEEAAQLAELQTKYAYYDQLTGLKNRRAFAEIESSFSENKPIYCCVIMADIDGLKEVNDTLGHDAGDELIIGATQCLCQSFDCVDTIYRIGGDEFSIVLTQREIDVEKCLEQLDKISAKWKGKYVDGISISHGYATSDNYTDFYSIQKAADNKMYSFKNEYYIRTGKERRV